MDDLLENVMAVGCILLMILCAGLVIYGVFIFFDWVLGSDREQAGVTVGDIDYHAPYTTFVYSGKVMVPVYHPARWFVHLRFMMDGAESGINFYYDPHLLRGTAMRATFSCGRFTDNRYVSKVE